MKKMKSSIQTTVMQEIEGGHVHMHSRLYFSLIAVTTVLAGVLGGVLLAYATSIASYIVRIQTASTPAYGARSNLADAIASFPWWLLVIAGLLIAGAVWMMRRYGQAYRHARTPIIVIFLLVSIALGVGLSFVNTDHSDGQNQRGNSRRTLR